MGEMMNNIFDYIDKQLPKKKRQILGLIMMFSFIFLAQTFRILITLTINGEFNPLFALFALNYLFMGDILLILVCYYLLTRVYKYEPAGKKDSIEHSLYEEEK